MPAPGGVKTACVTGGNGYIASALMKMLLEKGYAVKTTVRNPDDTEKKSHLKSLQALGGHLEVLRADLDEAVAGCHYAFLVAAPVNLASENPEEELIGPAVQGTLNVLRSCAKAGTVMKRVVLTSSAAAVVPSGRPLRGGDDGLVLLDEETWPDVDYRDERNLLIQEHENFPSFVRSSHRTTTQIPSDEVALGVLKGAEMLFGAVLMVDVDDLCRAEIFVAEREASSGRYVCCGLNTTVVELARFLSHKYPQYNVKTDVRSGELLEKPRVSLSAEKLVKEGYETLDDLYDDVVEYGKALGILST